MAYFPIFIELKKCLIIGGGKVALRKARTLVDFGAEVTVVSREFCSEFMEIQEVFMKKKSFDESDLDGQNLVFSAVNDESVNLEIIRLCRERKIPVNSAFKGTLGDFFFPSVIRDENLVIGISTSGKSPSFASRLKKILTKMIPAGLGKELEEISKVREESVENGSSPFENPEYENKLKNMEKLFC